MFNKEKLLQENVVVHCENKEQKEKLFNYFESHKYDVERRQLKQYNYFQFKNKVVYWLSDVQAKNYTILKYEDVLLRDCSNCKGKGSFPKCLPCDGDKWQPKEEETDFTFEQICEILGAKPVQENQNTFFGDFKNYNIWNNKSNIDNYNYIFNRYEAWRSKAVRYNKDTNEIESNTPEIKVSREDNPLLTDKLIKENEQLKQENSELVRKIDEFEDKYISNIVSQHEKNTLEVIKILCQKL